MAIIPTVRCKCMEASIAFYTEILDFEWVDGMTTRVIRPLACSSEKATRLFSADRPTPCLLREHFWPTL
jgi:catechol 2,3-dioxygenase-like lactoylglutathione lyase family enzyme